VLEGSRIPFSGAVCVNEQDAIELMDAATGCHSGPSSPRLRSCFKQRESFHCQNPTGRPRNSSSQAPEGTGGADQFGGHPSGS